MIELTEQQRKQVAANAGRPVAVIDPQTHRAYMLLERDQYDRVSALLDPPQDSANSAGEDLETVAPIMLKSQQAFWRDLPELLKRRKWRRQWVCYHGDERVGIDWDDAPLVKRCLQMGLKRGDFYIGWIEESSEPPWACTEIEESLFEFTDEPSASTSPQTTAPVEEVSVDIPPGIRKSQEAYWRDLPQLLQRRKWRGQWACYHGDERIGIGRTKSELVQHCVKLGLPELELYVGRIKERPTAPWIVTPMEESLFEFTD